MMVQGAMETVPKNAGALWTSWTWEADYEYLYGRLLADTFQPLDNKSKQFLFTMEGCLSVWQIILDSLYCTIRQYEFPYG